MGAHVAAGGGRAFACELTAGLGSLADARQQFERWLAEQTVEAEHAADLIVVLSELAANAIAAGEADHEGPIVARAWRAGDGLVLEVENALEDRIGGIAAPTDSDALRGSGRGLVIVAAYTDRIEVIPPDQANGLIVRCHKGVGPRVDLQDPDPGPRVHPAHREALDTAIADDRWTPGVGDPPPNPRRRRPQCPATRTRRAP